MKQTWLWPIAKAHCPSEKLFRGPVHECPLATPVPRRNRHHNTGRRVGRLPVSGSGSVNVSGSTLLRRAWAMPHFVFCPAYSGMATATRAAEWSGTHDVRVEDRSHWAQATQQEASTPPLARCMQSPSEASTAETRVQRRKLTNEIPSRPTRKAFETQCLFIRDGRTRMRCSCRASSRIRRSASLSNRRPSSQTQQRCANRVSCQVHEHRRRETRLVHSRSADCSSGSLPTSQQKRGGGKEEEQACKRSTTLAERETPHDTGKAYPAKTRPKYHVGGAALNLRRSSARCFVSVRTSYVTHSGQGTAGDNPNTLDATNTATQTCTHAAMAKANAPRIRSV